MSNLPKQTCDADECLQPTDGRSINTQDIPMTFSEIVWPTYANMEFHHGPNNISSSSKISWVHGIFHMNFQSAEFPQTPTKKPKLGAKTRFLGIVKTLSSAVNSFYSTAKCQAQHVLLFAEDLVRGLDLLGGGFCFFISKLGKMDPFGLVVQPPASLTWNVKTLV